MPLLKLETTVVLSEDNRKSLLTSLSKAVAGTIGKPEQYVMVSIGGLTGDVNRKLSQQICKLLNDSLGIAPDRVYLNFTDVEASNWGWNGSTFG